VLFIDTSIGDAAVSCELLPSL